MRCPTCKGTGQHWHWEQRGIHGPQEYPECEQCGGSGTIAGDDEAPSGCGAWLAGWVARIVLALVVFVIIGVVVFAIAYFKARNHGLEEARPSGDVTTEGYAVGTCLDEAFAAAIPVACDREHEAEVYRILEVVDPTSEDYPGSDRLDDFAAEFCPEHFEAYVGENIGSTDLSLGSRSPTENEWKIGLRRVLCFTGGGPKGPIVGSVRDAGGS